MHHAALTQKIPSACILLASNYLCGVGVEKDYLISEKYLQDALTYGIIEDQFLSNNFLGSFCSYIDMVITNLAIPTPQKEHFLSIIKEKLENHKVPMDEFYQVVYKETKINLPLHPEWTKEKAWKLGHKTKKAQTSLLQLHLESAIEKKEEKITYQQTEEDSSAFLSGIKAYEQKDIQKAMRLLTVAAIHEHIPTACIIISAYHLKGKHTHKSYFWSECFLREALQYGITTKTFYSDNFLDGLCQYIKVVIKNSHPPLIRHNLLFMIKKALETNQIDHTKFYGTFQKVTNIELTTHPEWSTDDNNQKIKIINSLKKILVKSETNDEDPDNFVTTIAEYIKQQDTERSNTIRKITTKHPTSSMQFAFMFLTGQSLSLNHEASKDFLLPSLTEGLKEKKFPNLTFLHILFWYIEELITQKSNAHMRYLLSVIKKILIAHEIKITAFNTVFKEMTYIDLSSIPEWSTQNKTE